MRITYAFRRATLHPEQGAALPRRESLRAFLRQTRSLGFEAIELGLEALIADRSEAAARELRAVLEDAGLPCSALRGGGGQIHPRVGERNRQSLAEAIRVASWLGAKIVNMTVTTPPSDPNGPGASWGERVCQGSSRNACEEDYERTARRIQEAAGMASDQGVDIAIEIHQHSIADNSWSALHLLELIDRPNVGLNPDLGNIYWAYDVPEESCEEAIVKLAPHAKYWHCKNLMRVHVPEHSRAIFLQVPLPDGEIDYRFALSAMIKAGYAGEIAIEGIRLGDQFWKDGQSVEYIKSLLAS